MTQTDSVAVKDDLLTAITAAFPRLSPREAKLGRQLYRELLKGQPVSRERLATLLWVPTQDLVATLASERLARLLMYDDLHRITGFAGLSLEETPFAFEIGQQRLFTWCAWDGLFIPEMIALTANLRSRCPETGRSIHVTVGPDRIVSVDPPDTVLSFTIPNATACLCGPAESRRDFCDRVLFFGSLAAADRWAKEVPGAFVLGLTEAFELARAFNAVRFHDSQSTRSAVEASP